MTRYIGGAIVSLATTASVCALLGACKKDGFKGRTPPPKAETLPGAKDPSKSPNEVDASDTGKVVPKTEPVLPPGKLVVLELQPAPPESWWNNCVHVIYKGQVFDGGCSKSGGGLKTLIIPVAEQDACAALTFQVKTFRNQGDECQKRKAQGQACEGPYGSTPDQDRLSASAEGAPHFKWERTPSSSDSTVSFEDQPKANLDAANANPALVKERGIDFNDVVIHVKPKGVSVTVQQSQKDAASPVCK